MSGLIESWVETANDPEGGFPVNNLPYGVYYTPDGERRCCVAIGAQALDLGRLEATGLIDSSGSFESDSLNDFMSLGDAIWTRVRARLTDLLKLDGSDDLRNDAALREVAVIPQDQITMCLPFKVSEFTDFYAGRNHAQNVGTMFRGPENALPPNWLHIPIGYNGRASTVVVSGTDIVRPSGQLKGPEFDAPVFAPSRRLDIELEMGVVVGQPSQMGKRVSVAEADDMIFGYVLLNDWSARDIQAWEYQPLGPFQAKAFATSISPWIVPKAALEPFRVSTPDRDHELLDYLVEPGPMLYDVDLEVAMTANGADVETIISRTNYREMYYSAAQQLAHHASSGCAMNVGDLLGSGTISGTTKDSFGSLLEISWGGKEPFSLDDGSVRTFIEDGDELTLRGAARGAGYCIGFGECRGKILPAN